MDYQNFNYIDKRSSGFTTASFVLSIIGIATGCCVYTGIICGALAIMFALLSKGGETTMNTKAKIGLGLGIISIIFGILIFIGGLAIVIYQYGSFDAYMNEYMDILNNLDSSYPYTL